jgi:hypothetical protein
LVKEVGKAKHSLQNLLDQMTEDFSQTHVTPTEAKSTFRVLDAK